MSIKVPKFQVSIDGRPQSLEEVNIHLQDQPFPGNCSYTFTVRGAEAVAEFLLWRDDFNELSGENSEDSDVQMFDAMEYALRGVYFDINSKKKSEIFFYFINSVDEFSIDPEEIRLSGVASTVGTRRSRRGLRWVVGLWVARLKDRLLL